jgi:hypothetical protein
MQAAFGAAIDAIFRDANVAEDAIWRAGGAGDGIAVRVIRKSPDEVVGFGSSRAVMATVLIDVRALEIASPASGDTGISGRWPTSSPSSCNAPDC